jgi:hypothetical protein
MEAEIILLEAEYHLQRMRELNLNNMKHFKYELNAFLFNARSIPDVLLEDFNKIFSLGISSETKINSLKFEKIAYQLNNIQALTFLLWWTRYKNTNIVSDLIFSMLFNKRTISIHTKIMESERVNETSIFISGEWKVYDEDGTLVTQTPQKPMKSTTSDWFFTDYPDTNALEACEKLFEILKSFIEEAKNQFM